MEFDRRRTLRLGAVSLSTILAAGCLSGTGPDASTEGSGSTTTDGGDGSDPTTTSDDDTGELPRTDTPPYDITEPECGDDGRDPFWLCENMPAEPSIEFEQVDSTSVLLADEGLGIDEPDQEDEYYATFLTAESDLERLHDEASGRAVELMEGTNFETHVVLIAQHGWGSGSKTPHLKRIEATNTGIRAHGCTRQPCAHTDDYTVRSVIARFARLDTLDGSRVSLTVDPETRVTFGVNDW